MRILILSHFYDGHHGGPQILAREMGKRMAKEGDEVAWMATSPVVGTREPGIRYLPVSGWNPMEKRFGIPYPIWGPLALLELKREISKVDLIHIHDVLFTGSLAAVVFGRLLKKPVVITQHAGLIPYPNPLFRWAMSAGMRSLGVSCLKSVSTVVFESDGVSEYFNERRVKFKRSKKIRNGVDTDLFYPSSAEHKATLRKRLGLNEKGPLILFVGRFIWKKGLHHIEALAKAFPDCQFVLVGYGPIDPRRWSLDNVLVIDGCLHSDLVQYYQAADLLVSPGVGEGIPLVIQEAMACGLICLISAEIANAMPGLKENCYWPATKETSYADLLNRFLQKVPLSGGQRNEVRQFAEEHWCWKNCIEAYKRVFMQACANDWKN